MKKDLKKTKQKTTLQLFLILYSMRCFQYLSLISIYTTAGAAFSTTSATKLKRLLCGRGELSVLLELSVVAPVAAETVLRGG